MIRSFLAIELPFTIIKKIKKVQDDLKSSLFSVKWVRPESIHLTLKFFGNIEEESIEEISRVITGVTSKFSPFHLEIRDIGAFPSLIRPRVIWVGVDERGDTLKILYNMIEKNLETIGFDPEQRQFNPHLTLGRVKSLEGKRTLIDKVEQCKGCDLGVFQVEALYLFKSELRPAGAVYSKLSTFKLTGS
ncbi:MAG: RNA 2',3'-cyclic phosphodiesterase [Thermodesulfobacteriota bacterium]|nr:RNA 2',3'-cyclic phosphodiesterase [Thermodesulfobacteriota bacterium]